jgi:hypothetical protein
VAYYDLLIAKWPSVTGANVTAKLANLNGQTVTGAVPSAFTVTGSDIYNCLVGSEWTALTAANQQNVRDIFNLPTVHLGTAATAQIALLAIFGAGTATRANLVALAQATSQPWWQANGYKAPINDVDLTTAGLS